MSVQVENLEKNMAKLTIQVPAEDFEKAVQGVYQKQKNRISLPGFRKGKAPRKMIEKMYGTGIFYEDAANALIPQAYSDAAAESGLNIVSNPAIDVVQIESGKDFVFTAEVAVKPEVTLGEYKGLEVPKAVIEVRDEEVEAELKKEQERNSRVVAVDDRPVADGDTVRLDFEGFVDGKAFEGGKGEDYPLVIGSHSFIPGFEEALIGAEIGKETEVNVTFPEDYQTESLAGKPAVFKCRIGKIEKKELPELDDEFAKDVSEFDTLDEYKADIRKTLAEKKEGEAKTEKENAAVDAAVANAKMEIPEAMVATQVEQMVNDFTNRVTSQGLSMEQYIQITGQTPEMMRDQMRPQAMQRIQSRLVLEKIAETEKIEVSDERIEEELTKMAEMYKMEVDKIKELVSDGDRKQMAQDIAVQEAVTLIAAAAVEVEKAEEAAEA